MTIAVDWDVKHHTKQTNKPDFVTYHITKQPLHMQAVSAEPILIVGILASMETMSLDKKDL